jgi:hypothetical protein
MMMPAAPPPARKRGRKADASPKPKPRRGGLLAAMKVRGVHKACQPCIVYLLFEA